ncbi:MAG TPA: hypothetical protein ENI23_00185 [bacterium]|nr:hypothetical protein [bacterium]
MEVTEDILDEVVGTLSGSGFGFCVSPEKARTLIYGGWKREVLGKGILSDKFARDVHVTLALGGVGCRQKGYSP